MVQNPVPHLPGQVQSASVLFQTLHHTQTLHIMREAARIPAKLIQLALACMPKGGMP